MKKVCFICGIEMDCASKRDWLQVDLSLYVYRDKLKKKDNQADLTPITFSALLCPKHVDMGDIATRTVDTIMVAGVPLKSYIERIHSDAHSTDQS